MTMLELKRELTRLKPRELKEVHAHLVRLRHATPEWRRAMARKLRRVEAGRFVTATDLEKQIARE